MGLHLPGQVLPGPGIGQVEPVFVDQHGLVFQPSGPSFLAYTLPYAFAQFTGVGGEVKTFCFFTKLDALNRACHEGTFVREIQMLKKLRSADSRILACNAFASLRRHNAGRTNDCEGLALNFVTAWFDNAPRRMWAGMGAVCIALLLFGLYLQHVGGLEPCPMCIVQRYALVLVAVCALLTGAFTGKVKQLVGGSLTVLFAGFGAFVAARQSWLQWYPPEVQSCGRDLFGMIETFPLQRLVPMIFRGSGDCSKIDWTFLGGSIANWSFLCFVAIGLVALSLVVRLLKRP
jgi:protein dithiol:quinone oxidoreductase